ncbi:hypothetical protein QQX09_05840 [Demequina sp. SYSU T00192]|uniref:Uncharacterized protein n=1 Tax=Demequina litoralis TaxID=3051660 RepID=A0ABT8G8I6_9MICO|nr:hypothetical protein [Demequina sp. SYSU T00192]MDN4475377.1 hypothetical protein [Demequina sp. SYSU T00192]
MREMNDVLRDGFEAHASALGAAGVDPGLGSGAARAAHRRRTRRAIGSGLGAAAVVGAVGVAAFAVGGDPAAPPAAVPAATSDAADCAALPYVAPNAAALGDAPYAFRAYVDLRADAVHPGVVVVLPDGTWSRLEPDAEGRYLYALDGQVYIVSWPREETGLDDMAMVVDHSTDGSAGGGDWDGVNPVVADYAWTVDIPADVPDGIDTALLSSTLRTGIGLGGLGYLGTSVPAGATTEAVVTTASGTTTTPMGEGSAMPPAADDTAVESVALRVSGLPGGGTFSIVAHHDLAGILDVACVDPAAEVAPDMSLTAGWEPGGGPAVEPSGSSPAPSVSLAE